MSIDQSRRKWIKPVALAVVLPAHATTSAGIVIDCDPDTAKKFEIIAEINALEAQKLEIQEEINALYRSLDGVITACP